MPLEIVRRNLIEIEADAIVNSTNPAGLPGGNGVDAAVHAAAGPELRAAIAALGGIPVGTAAATASFGLSGCRRIFHTSAPVWQGGQSGERELLARCFRSVFALAGAEGCRSVAVPMLGAGANGFPARIVYEIAAGEARAYLSRTDDDLRIILAIYDRETAELRDGADEGIDRYLAASLAPRPAPQAKITAASNLAAGMAMPRPAPAAERRGIFRRRRGNRAEDLPAPALSAADEARREEPEEEAAFDAMEITGALPAFDLSVRAEDLDKSFGEMVAWWIEEKGLRPAEFYTRANLTKATYSSIKNHPERVPKKTTALACVIGLELDLEQANDLLKRAGLTISHSNMTDVIVEYFICRGNYDIDQINLELYERDLALLGARNE